MNKTKLKKAFSTSNQLLSSNNRMYYGTEFIVINSYVLIPLLDYIEDLAYKLNKVNNKEKHENSNFIKIDFDPVIGVMEKTIKDSKKIDFDKSDLCFEYKINSIGEFIKIEDTKINKIYFDILIELKDSIKYIKTSPNYIIAYNKDDEIIVVIASCK